MRYYAIKIDGAPQAFPAVPGASVAGAQWCSVVNGNNDPGAMQIEFSLEEKPHDEQAASNGTVTIHGIPFDQIRQTSYLINKPVHVYGGMSKGLPLATAQSQYAGLLLTGQIVQCWSQWVGTDMSLGFAIAGGQISQDDSSSSSTPSDVTTVKQEPSTGRGVGPVMVGSLQDVPRYNRVGGRGIDKSIAPLAADATAGVIGALAQLASSGFENIGGVTSYFFGQGGTVAKPLNIVHNMMPNMLLSDAIKKTLNVAFPNAKINISISPSLKLAYQDAGMYQSLPQYAAYIKQLSHSILGSDKYGGVRMSSHGPSIDVWDATGGPTSVVSGNKVTMGFVDLIGQPSWIGVNSINFKTVMRSDIHIGMFVKLPPTLMTVTQAAGYEGAKAGVMAFDGDFVITSVTHIGDFRNPDGNAWCTVYEAATSDSQGGQDTAASTTATSNSAQNPSAIEQQYADAVKNISTPPPGTPGFGGPGGPVATPAPGTPGPGKPGESMVRSVRRYW